MGLVNNIFKKLADTYFPVGTIYITKSNTNPGTIVGGTWELKHRFSELTSNVSNPNNCFTFNSTNTTKGTFRVTYRENTAWVKCTYLPRVNISDSGYVIGVLSTAIGGVFYANPCIPGFQDGSYGYMVMGYHGATSGTVSTANLAISDLISYSGASTYGTSSTVTLCFPVLMPNIQNEYCDEWHWVRTA